MAVRAIGHIAPTTVYAIDVSVLDEVVFDASVHYGYRLQIPKNLEEYITENQERELFNNRWNYHYSIKTSLLDTTQDNPFSIRLNRSFDEIPIEVRGNAAVEGIDENGMAEFGSNVSIEVLTPGETLVLVSEDEKGNTVYTAMELDDRNRYEFTVEKELSFVIVNPDEAGYVIANAAGRKAKLTGVAGLKLKSLTSSAQGYREIVLNFTAVVNGSDGTETEAVYYEVKVTPAPKNGEGDPGASAPAPKYYYVKKTENINIQSKSIIVAGGMPSELTASTYEFSVRLVLISKTTNVPNEDTAVTTPLEPILSGNMITKSFATKSLYYEDKLGFTKKNTKIFTGQSDVLTGMVKYSKKASYLHDLTAVAYNGGGAVCTDITCTFKNDNDELYVSADEYTRPGKYTVVIYAAVGDDEGKWDEATNYNPQGGSMYQANTSFTLTVEAGINDIDTNAITRLVSVANKNVTFSVVPKGWGGTYNGYKAKKQNYTYEIKSARKIEGPAGWDNIYTGTGYETVEPTDKVRNSISVNKNGKVTIKKGYTVDAQNGEDYIAVVIKAADFENNDTTETVYIRILNTILVPTQIYLENSKGYNLGTRFSVNEADYSNRSGKSGYVSAKVIVLDQFGNNMNQYVTITPAYNASGNRNYVYHGIHSSSATLYIYKVGNITVKAVSTDGGKKSKSVKFKVTVPELKQELYSVSSITYNGSYTYEYKQQTGLVTYSAPRGSMIKVYNGFEINYDTHKSHNYNSDQCECIGSYNRSWYNWQYEVKGGKYRIEGNLCVVTPTEKTAILYTWPKSNPKQRTSIKFVNNNWNSSYETAPKITLTSGKLYANKYSGNDDLEWNIIYDDTGVSEQELTYHYDSGNYDWVRIERVSNKAPWLWLEDFNSQERTFKLSADPEGLKPGSYKYKVAFYNTKQMKNEKNETVYIDSIAAKNTTITVRVYKAPKIKIAASYTLKTEQADSIALKCTPGDFIPDFETKVLNANVGGKTNDFSKYFEVVVSEKDLFGVSRASIKFKNTVTAEEKAALKGKSITGYVKYSYYYGYNHIRNAASKVTIKIK